MTRVRFDDLETLQRYVTDQFGAYGPEVRVTQEMIDAFAALTGDGQWIHVDVERAKRESPFGGTVAHGFLTLSLLPALLPSPPVEIIGHGHATNLGADKLRFVGPVPAGSTLHARVRIVGVEAKRTGTQVASEAAVYIVGTARPVLLCTMILVYAPPRE